MSSVHEMQNILMAYSVLVCIDVCTC